MDMIYKKYTSDLCTSFKKSKRMNFSIDFSGGVLYIIVSEGKHSVMSGIQD